MYEVHSEREGQERGKVVSYELYLPDGILVGRVKADALPNVGDTFDLPDVSQRKVWKVVHQILQSGRPVEYQVYLK